jgi:hypothetical protein
VLTATLTNCISFKALYGSLLTIGSSSRSSEIDWCGLLDPSRAYFWKWTWGSEVRLWYRKASASDPLQLCVGTAGTYCSVAALCLPRRETQGSVEEGSRPGAIIRQVWISDKPRPDTLGNALD